MMLHKKKYAGQLANGFKRTGVTTETNYEYMNGNIWFTYVENKSGIFLLTLFFPEGHLGPCKL